MSPNPFLDSMSPSRLLNDSRASAHLLASAFEDAHLADHVYRHRNDEHIGEVGFHFDADLDAAHAWLEKTGARYFARTQGDEHTVRAYRLGASVILLTESEDRKRTDNAECHTIGRDASGKDAHDVFCDMVRAFQVKDVVRVPRTTVQVLTANRGNYQLQSIGYETTELVPENYAPAVVAALRGARADLVAKEPPGRLLLLEGPPGTGKTRAMRALLAELKGAARVVIVPSDLVADLAGPNLLGALLGCSMPTVLVIEDADYALLDREARSGTDKQGATGALSALLNLSDGILGAQVDLRIITTTNAKIADLDAAVLRPGRLLARIEVGRLSADDARRALAHALDGVEGVPFDAIPAGDLSLAEVYHLALCHRRGLPLPEFAAKAALPAPAARHPEALA